MLDAVIHTLSHLLVPTFLFGMAGSAIVVVVTLTRDLTDFLSDSGSEAPTQDSLH